MSKNQKRRHFDKYGAAEEKPSKSTSTDTTPPTLRKSHRWRMELLLTRKIRLVCMNAGGWDWVDIVSHLSKGPNKPEAIAA